MYFLYILTYICTCRNRIDAVHKFQPPSEINSDVVSHRQEDVEEPMLTECFKSPTLDCGARDERLMWDIPQDRNEQSLKCGP